MAPEQPRSDDVSDFDPDDVSAPSVADSDEDINLRVGRETDAVVQHFGHLSEGVTVDDDTSDDTFDLLRSRWQQRRDLLAYTTFPEGYEFLFRLVAHPFRAVVLLTPPHLVAVLHVDGSWTREQRQEAVHGPAPYTHRLYQEYLAANNLPEWFLSEDHLAMADDDAEANLLGVSNELSADVEPPQDYLEHRYRGGIRYPVPDSDGDYMIRGDLSTGHASQVSQLARRFPALGLRAAGVEYNVVVTSSGHVVLTSREEKEEELSDVDYSISLDEVEWEYENDDEPQASYYIEDPATLPVPSQATSVVDRDRTLRVQGADRARAAGATVNPTRPMPGVGRYAFVTPQDQQLATRLGFGLGRSHDILQFRAAGGFAGLNDADAPAVAWYPDLQYWNPVQLPAGHGRFAFATVGGESSDDVSAAYLGGDAQGHGLPDQPSARDIWDYRRRNPRSQITQQVDIIWIPGEDVAPGDPSRRRPSPVVTDPDVNSSTKSESEEIDWTNGEPGTVHDQTERYQGRGLYHTRVFGNTSITLDRHRCNVGYVEPHKLYIYGPGGWSRWPKYSTIVWNDKTLVDQLNKWREQNLRRWGWEKLRTDDRQDYTDEQNGWLYEFVEESDGALPKESIEHIMKAFNKKFKQQRNETGISAVINRLRKKYSQGGLGERKGRGWKQKQDKEEKEKKAKEKKAPRKQSLFQLVPKKRKRDDSQDDSEELPSPKQK